MSRTVEKVKYEKTKERLMCFLKLLLNSMTVVELEEEIHFIQKNWYCCYSFISFASIGLSAVSVMCSASGSYERYLAAETAGAIFSTYSIMFVSQIQSKNLTDIFRMVRDGISDNVKHPELNITYKDTYEHCIAWAKRFGGFLIAFVSSTIFTTLLTAIATRDYDTRDGTTLLYPSRYPWDFSTGRMYTYTYIWQLITTFPIFMIIWGNMAFTMIMVIVFRSYTEELLILIKNINSAVPPEVIQGKYEKSPEAYELIQKYYQDEIITCIQLHQQLRRYFNKFKDWFNLLFAAEIAYVTVEISVLSYAVLKERQSYGNSIKLAFFAVVVLAQLYFHCNVGEKFYEMNEIVTTALFDIIYDIKYPKVQKLMLMFAQQSQIPLTLRAFKTWRASLHMLEQILRVSYGFFNVFRATDY